jgi:hypothetical protein
VDLVAGGGSGYNEALEWRILETHQPWWWRWPKRCTGGTGGSGIVILKYLAKPNMQIFQADGSWTCPTGITEVEYLVVAGGGGGGGNLLVEVVVQGV